MYQIWVKVFLLAILLLFPTLGFCGQSDIINELESQKNTLEEFLNSYKKSVQENNFSTTFDNRKIYNFERSIRLSLNTLSSNTWRESTHKSAQDLKTVLYELVELFYDNFIFVDVASNSLVLLSEVKGLKNLTLLHFIQIYKRHIEHESEKGINYTLKNLIKYHEASTESVFEIIDSLLKINNQLLKEQAIEVIHHFIMKNKESIPKLKTLLKETHIHCLLEMRSYYSRNTEVNTQKNKEKLERVDTLIKNLILIDKQSILLGSPETLDNEHSKQQETDNKETLENLQIIARNTDKNLDDKSSKLLLKVAKSSIDSEDYPQTTIFLARKIIIERANSELQNISIYSENFMEKMECFIGFAGISKNSLD